MRGYVRTEHWAGSGFKFLFSNPACFQNWETGRRHQRLSGKQGAFGQREARVSLWSLLRWGHVM